MRIEYTLLQVDFCLLDLPYEEYLKYKELQQDLIYELEDNVNGIEGVEETIVSESTLYLFSLLPVDFERLEQYLENFTEELMNIYEVALINEENFKEMIFNAC